MREVQAWLRFIWPRLKTNSIFIVFFVLLLASSWKAHLPARAVTSLTVLMICISLLSSVTPLSVRAILSHLLNTSWIQIGITFCALVFVVVILKATNGIFTLQDDLVGLGERHGLNVDTDTLLALILSLLLSLLVVGVMIVTGILRNRYHLHPMRRKSYAQLRFMNEMLWLMGTIVIALAPAAVHASWVPSIAAGVYLPVITLMARSHFNYFCEKYEAN